MIKKLLIVGAGVALLAALFAGRDVLSYGKTAVDKAHASLKHQVPVEFEIDRARKMIADLKPEIRRNMEAIAEEEVEVENLRENVEAGAEQLAAQKGRILRLKTDLETSLPVYVYAGDEYTREQVQSDLKARFERFKTKESTVENLRKVLNAREKGLAAARQKLEGMIAAKKQLEVDVENLQARLKMVEVAATTSDFNFDDSHLARTRELLQEIQTRIDVAEKMANVDDELTFEIPLDKDEQKADVVDEVTAYFGDAKPAAGTIADAALDAAQ